MRVTSEPGEESLSGSVGCELKVECHGFVP